MLPDGSHLSYDTRHIVQVGDRGIPEKVLYRHFGDDKHPERKIRIEVWDGVPVIAEVSLIAKPDEGVHVRARDIRELSAELETSLTDWLAWLARVRNPKTGAWELSMPVPAAQRRAAAKAVAGVRRQTRRKMTDKHLRLVADTYNNAGGQPRHEAIAAAFGVDRRTAQRYIEKAREAGYLPPSTRRKAQR